MVFASNRNADSSSARRLFRFSLMHLPLVLLLLYAHKREPDADADAADWTLRLLRAATAAA